MNPGRDSLASMPRSAPTRDPDAPEFSAIVTCYFEEQSIDEFHERLSGALRASGRSFEIVLVNDGSTDGTLERLHAIFERDEHVAAVVDLVRNSGQAAAVTAGCEQARGEKFVFMDSDLQLDPEELPRFVAESDKGMDVVNGYRTTREDPLHRRFASWLANGLAQWLSRSPVRDLGCTYKIVDGRIVRAFQPGPFKPLHAPSLVAAGGRVAEVPVTHHPRRYGRSGWTLRKLLAFNVHTLVDLSERPFQVLSLVCFAASLLLALRVVASAVFPGSVLSEISNGLILNAVALGLLITVGVLAVLGEYVVRSYARLRGSPAYIVRTLRRRD